MSPLSREKKSFLTLKQGPARAVAAGPGDRRRGALQRPDDRPHQPVAQGRRSPRGRHRPLPLLVHTAGMNESNVERHGNPVTEWWNSVHEQRDSMKLVKDDNIDKTHQYEGLRPQGSVLVAQTEAEVSVHSIGRIDISSKGDKFLCSKVI